MGIKICGHIVRWHKPIKVYNFFKAGSLALLLAIFVCAPVSAADYHKNSSTGSEVACNPLQDKCMTAPAKLYKPENRLQRKAGTHSMSPALALAMALGLRNVQGPLERRHVSETARGVIKTDGPERKLSSNASGIRLALENRF